MKKPCLTEPLPECVTIQEAASMLGLCERTVYFYIEDGSLPAFRLGKSTVLKKEDVDGYQRKAPGRLRIRTPAWHTPPTHNPALLTTITVQILPGQGERLESRLDEIRQQGTHTFAGTAQRYISRSLLDPNRVQMLLIWRGATLPSEEERAAALAAFRAELADLLDWQTASTRESRLLLLA